MNHKRSERAVTPVAFVVIHAAARAARARKKPRANSEMGETDFEISTCQPKKVFTLSARTYQPYIFSEITVFFSRQISIRISISHFVAGIRTFFHVFSPFVLWAESYTMCAFSLTLGPLVYCQN